MPPIEPPATAEQRLDAEMVEQHGLRPHHVADGDDRKFQAPGLAGRRIGRGRAGRAHAGADHIRADHEIAFGVDRPAGADHGLPPARLLGDRMHVGDVLIAGERVADQHGIDARGVERAVGLVGDLERRRVRRRHRAAAACRRQNARPANAAGPPRAARSAHRRAASDSASHHVSQCAPGDLAGLDPASRIAGRFGDGVR